MSFGEQLAALLTKYHRSQRELSRISGVHYVTVNRIVNNYPFRVSADTARKLAKAIGCTKQERDELVKLAGRLPKDVEDMLLLNPDLIKLVRKQAKR